MTGHEFRARGREIHDACEIHDLRLLYMMKIMISSFFTFFMAGIVWPEIFQLQKILF